MRRIVLLVVLAGLVAGCGARDVSPPPPGVPLPRYDTLAELGRATLARRVADQTARFHLTGVTAGGGNPQSVAGEGAMSLTGGGLSMQVTQHIQLLGGRPGPDTTLVIVPTDAYLKVPDTTGTILPPGRSWFHLRDDSSSPAMHQFWTAVQNLRENVDPTQSLSRMGGAVRIVGTEQELLDGIWTMHYRIELDLAAAAQASPDERQRTGLARLVAAGATTDDTELWLDGHNRLRRMMLTRGLLDAQGRRTTYTLTLRYRDWGAPVQVTAPPPDQVVGD
jgi:hypothetical protein